MTQPSQPNVIYLPAGVVPPQQAAPTPLPVGPQPPFNKQFFSEVLPQVVRSFCSQVKCDMPVVELLTMDGARHYINAISGVSEQWVALQTTEDHHEHPTQVFIPYATIFRVEVHPEPDGTRGGRIGFRAAMDAQKPPELDQSPQVEVAKTGVTSDDMRVPETPEA
jgi:hypothetical protein